MLELALIPIRAIAFVALVLLPGAWLTFGPLGRSLSPNIGILIAIALSPLVLVVQFHVLRLLGVPFGATAVLLVLLNLPAARQVLRRSSRADLPGLRDLPLAAAFLCVPFAFLLAHFQDLQVRALYGHAWLHADIVYRIMAGDLWPEDSSLAGFAINGPWVGHVYQALLSYVLNSTPVSSYIWTNALWLLAIFGMTAAVTARLGGDRFAQVLACMFLAFAVNPIGSALQQFLPQDIAAVYGKFLSDSGYTPWLRKYFGFDQIQLGLGGFAALLVLSLRRCDPEARGGMTWLIGLQLCAIGIFYPLLFPAGCFVLIAQTGAMWLTAPIESRAARLNDSIAILGAILLAAIPVYVAYVITAEGRWAGLAPALDGSWVIKTKAAKALVALSIPLLGFVLAAPLLWRTRRHQLVLIALATLACIAVYVTLDIPDWRNEYKYILAAAICLAPFPAIALQPILGRLGRTGTLLAAVIVALLAIPPAWRIYDKWPPVAGYRPQLVVEGLAIALAPGERFAGALAAIRESSPADALVIAAETAVHLPTLTQRVHYAPFEKMAPLAGYAAGPDYFLIKGYPQGKQVLGERRRVLRQLYRAEGDAAREAALGEISALGRPLVVLIDLSSDAALQEWMVGRGQGDMIYRNQEAAVWVLPGV